MKSMKSMKAKAPKKVMKVMKKAAMKAQRFTSNIIMHRDPLFTSAIAELLGALLFVFTILITHSCISFVFDPTALFVDLASIVFCVKGRHETCNEEGDEGCVHRL